MNHRYLCHIEIGLLCGVALVLMGCRGQVRLPLATSMATVQPTLTRTSSPSPLPITTVAPIVMKPWYQIMITDTATISKYLQNALFVTQLDQQIVTYTLTSMQMGFMEQSDATLKYRMTGTGGQIRFEQSQNRAGQNKTFFSMSESPSSYGELTEYIDPKTHLTFRADESNAPCKVEQTKIGEAAWGGAMSLVYMSLFFAFDTMAMPFDAGSEKAVRYIGNYVGVEAIDGQPTYRFRLNMSQTSLGTVIQYTQPLAFGDIWIAVVDGRNQIKRVSINTTDRIDDGGRPRQNEMLYGELLTTQPQDYSVPLACKKAQQIALTATPQYIDDIHTK